MNSVSTEAPVMREWMRARQCTAARAPSIRVARRGEFAQGEGFDHQGEQLAELHGTAGADGDRIVAARPGEVQHGVVAEAGADGELVAAHPRRVQFLQSRLDGGPVGHGSFSA